MSTRVEKWKKQKSIDLFIDYSNNAVISDYLKSINYDSNVLKDEINLFENARELIFDIKDGEIKIHVISQVFCLDTFKLKTDQILEIIFEDDNFEDVKNTIAIALALDVPLYPNTPELEKDLSKYYKSILETGFTAPGKDGEKVRLKATNSKNIDDFHVQNLEKIDTTKYWSALDLLILKENLHDEFLKLSNAQRTLNYLEIAIAKLENELDSKTRNENELQKILTNNPILFGIDYSNIIPKHKLGAEYELDYALEKHSGIIDVVEIESSNLKLFTKQGNPTKDLVHAEQQIIDWLNWIERNNSYANTKISGFISPKGFVVIGTNSQLTDKDRQSLIRRNKVFNDIITVLTYDDLLAKAKTMLEVLKK